MIFLIYVGIGLLLALFQMGVYFIYDSLYRHDECLGFFFVWFLLWPIVLIFAITLGMIRFIKENKV